MAPIYNFKCEDEDCKEEFEEIFISWNDDTKEVKCPKCGKSAKKVPSLIGVQKQNWSKWRI